MPHDAPKTLVTLSATNEAMAAEHLPATPLPPGQPGERLQSQIEGCCTAVSRSLCDITLKLNKRLQTLPGFVRVGVSKTTEEELPSEVFLASKVHQTKKPIWIGQRQRTRTKSVPSIT